MATSSAPSEARSSSLRLPEGTSQIVFVLTEQACHPESVAVGSLHAALCFHGPHLHALHLPSQSYTMVGLVLKPGAVRAVLGISASDCCHERYISLTSLWGDVAKSLMDTLLAARTDLERLSALQDAVIARGPAPRSEEDGLAVQATAIIDQASGSLRLGELERRTGYSQRALRYSFERCVGQSPKHYSRVSRLRHCIRLASERSSVEWAEIAGLAAYSDQAHMTREFASMLGRTPNRLLHDIASAAQRCTVLDPDGRKLRALDIGLVPQVC